MAGIMKVNFHYFRSSDPRDSVSGTGQIVYWYTRPCRKLLNYSTEESGEPRAVVVDDKGKFHDIAIHSMSQILEKA